MRSKDLICFATALFLLLTVTVPLACPGSDADSADDLDIFIVDGKTSRELTSGDAITFSVCVTNLSSTEVYILAPKASVSSSGVSVSISESGMLMHPGDKAFIHVTIHADKYGAGDYTVNLTMEYFLALSEHTIYDKDFVIDVHVESALHSESSFNRILGFMTNPFPAPMNTPLATALITMVVGIILCMIIVMIFVPILTHILFRKDEREEAKVLRRNIEKALFGAVFLTVLQISLEVYGSPENFIASVKTWSIIGYVLLGAYISWKIYARVISFLLHKVKEGLDDDSDLDSDGRSDIEPLFRLVGQIVISAIAAAAICASYGLDLGAIITSMGIVSLGITFGAQSIIKQFFSGVVILMTRPFKKGDLIQLSGSKTYRVHKVGVMNTTLENWANEDITIMPNSSIADGAIVNLTGKTLTYKIHVYMTVAYGEDLNRAKQIMLDVGMNHPEVIIDGSVDMPYVRVTNFGNSEIELRLTLYIRDYNDYGSIGAQLSERIYNEFVSRGVKIPYPQLDVHLDYVKNE